MSESSPPSLRRVAHALFLACLVGTAVVIGCKSSPPPTAPDLLTAGLQRTESAIREVVADPERRDEALRVIEEFGEIEERLLAETSEVRKRLKELNDVHGTTRESMQIPLDEL
ncbi:MAG: hypothetical protein AAGA20_23335, partial [Planctomycetota bacterium]